MSVAFPGPAPSAGDATAPPPPPAAAMGPSRLLRHGLPLLIYTLAALLLTWPLAAHFATHVPGDGIDDPSLAWNLWWLADRLVRQVNFDIFHVGWMFHPVTINLAFYTLTPLHGLLSMPLQWALGLTVANNVILLSTFVLGGYGAFLLLLDLLAPLAARGRDGASARPAAGQRERALWTAALLAGFFYAFAAPKLFYVSLGQFNIAASQWIPFVALYALRLMRARTAAAAMGAGAMVGLFFVLQAWSELTYASFLLLYLALVFLFALIDPGARHRLQGVLTGFIVAAAVAVVGLTPILAAMLPDLRAEGDFFASGGGFADIFSADLAGYLYPTRLHPLAGDLAAALPFPNDKGQQVFLGYTALALAVVGLFWLWRRSRVQALFWSVAAVGFWLLSLGPSLRWMGRDLAIPGPFALVSQLPFFNGNRYPSRYSVMLILCVAVLAGTGVVALIGWLQRRGVRRASLWAGALVAALLVAEQISTPLPMSDMRVPTLYARLDQEPDDLALLELPTGWRNGARVLGYSDELIMRQQWWQSVHGKRRLGGNTSRNPAHKFQYYTESRLMGDLIALMNADRHRDSAFHAATFDGLALRYPDGAAQELADLGVGFVTLHVDDATPELLRFVEEVMPLELIEEWQGADPQGDPATIRLYRVLPPDAPEEPPDSRTIRAAAPEARHFVAEGWSIAADERLYATRPASHLLLPLPDEGGALQIRATQAPVRLLLNGRARPGTWDGETLTIPFAAGETPELMDRVTLQWPAEGVPVTGMADERSEIGATGHLLPAGRTLVAVSAGEEVGDFAELWVNGVNVAAELPQRGYLLAAMQPSGALLEAAAFDTHGDPTASGRMAAWIDQWPQETIVMGAVADEGSLQLDEEGRRALRTLGLDAVQLACFRCSHAFVGVVGAGAGQALEARDAVRPAVVWVGAPVNGARVYGAIDEISWTTRNGEREYPQAQAPQLAQP